MAYRTSRNIEASIIDFLKENFDDDWTGISVEKSFARIYDITLPSICIRTNVTSHDKAEIGENSTKRTVQVLIDIFGSDDGNKLDLTDYIVEKIKGGCPYYIYTISHGIIQSKTASGRIRVTSIEVTPVDDNTEKSKQDVHDRFRNLITLSISLGKIEA